MTTQNIDKSLLDFWFEHGITEKDFYCRDCSKPLFDFSILEKVRLVGWPNKSNSLPALVLKDSKRVYHRETDEERWVILGRFLSGKRYQRVRCWDCFFKKLPALILEKKNEIKNTWMQKLRKNDLNHIPVAWQSPAFYFSLIFDISEEELKAEMDKFVTASPAFFQKKYGDRWKEEFEKYRQVQAKAGCTLEYFIEKLGPEEGKKRYKEVCHKKAVSLDNCVKKYGEEEGKKLFKEYCKKQEYAGCKIEYFIEKYGHEEGTKKYYKVNHQKAITLENMIRAHGEIKGKELYYKYLEKTIANNVGFSKVSQDLFKAVDYELGDLAKNSKWATKNGEAEIKVTLAGEIKKWVRPDYILDNKIIEFNGDYWHCNPQFYQPADMVPRFGNTAESVLDVWQNDIDRERALQKLGYKVLTVWENDFYGDLSGTIDRCVNFLKNS